MYYSGIYAIEARRELSMVNATSVGFGGLEAKDRTKFFDNLNDLSRMGLVQRKKKKRKKGNEFNDILSFMGA